MIGFILIGGLLLFVFLFYTISMAVEDGTLKALKKFEKIKNGENKSESNY